MAETLMEKTMKLQAIAVCLLMGCTTAHADKTMLPDQAKRNALLETLVVGQEFKVNQQTYQLLPEIFAVERAHPRVETQQALDQVGVSAASLVETKGNFVVYRGSQSRTTASATQQGPVSVFPTVINKRTKVIGVLQGTLVVKPKQMTDAASIGSAYGLDVVKEFPQIQTVIYRVQRNLDVITVFGAVSADPRVASAYPEILEHERVPN
jgi:hypothetical protein